MTRYRISWTVSTEGRATTSGLRPRFPGPFHRGPLRACAVGWERNGPLYVRRYTPLKADPLQETFDDLVDGSRGVDARVRLAVRDLTAVVQLLHRKPVGRERPAVIGWNAVHHVLERQVEPRDGSVGEHDRAVVGFREGSASGGHDDFAQR